LFFAAGCAIITPRGRSTSTLQTDGFFFWCNTKVVNNEKNNLENRPNNPIKRDFIGKKSKKVRKYLEIIGIIAIFAALI
jgi:hypothetical protein